MKILFVYPVTRPSLFKVQFSQGIGYLSAILKQAGYQIDLLCIHNYDKKEISNKIDSFKPDLIVVSSVTDQIELAKSIIGYIYEKYKLPIILGGVHPTIAPLESINIKGVFAVCIGEGEYALLELVKALEKNKPYLNIKNFWFKKENKIIKNPVRPLIEKLDSLPFPDRIIFDKTIDTDEIEFMGSRGCPYLCNYCINSCLADMYRNKGRFVRYRSVNNLLEEIEIVLKRYKTTRLVFHDDTFTINRIWLKEFCEKYPKKFKLPFVVNVRVETINREILKWLKDAGCSEIKIGVEAGNDHIRMEVLGRKITKEQIINTFKIIKEAGLNATSFNMIGIPFETEENIKETIELNREIQPYRMGVSIFRPYPGTKLYELCKNNKWISDRKIESYFEDISILDLPTISAKKIGYYHKIFPYCVWHPKLCILIKFIVRIRVYNLMIAFKNFLSKVLSREQKDYLMKLFKM